MAARISTPLREARAAIPSCRKPSKRNQQSAISPGAGVFHRMRIVESAKEKSGKATADDVDKNGLLLQKRVRCALHFQ